MSPTGDDKIRVAVICGGASAEHEVSLASARNIVAALDRDRFVVSVIGIDKAGVWHVQKPNTQIVSSMGPHDA